MNNLSNSNTIHQTSPSDLKDHVILLDGRIIQIEIGKKERVTDRDGNTKPMRLDILKPGNTLHESIYTSFRRMLSTHSLSYSNTALYAIANWFELTEMKGKFEVNIQEINLLSRIPASYRSFVIPLLRQISEHGMPGLSEQVCDFLAHPIKWEEQGTGAYFSLITNDPERGALRNKRSTTFISSSIKHIQPER